MVLTCCRAGGKKFVLKEVYPKDAFSYYEAMHQDLQACPYVRPVTDNVPEHLLLVFNYLDDHLLGLAQKNLPLPITKTTLKDALRGLAALHARNIVHTGMASSQKLSFVSDTHVPS